MLQLLIVLSSLLLANSLPYLNIEGFSWVENLIFDGLGKMFLSEWRQGKIYAVTLCNNGTEYCVDKWLDTDDFEHICGLSTSSDGKELYAGVTFNTEIDNEKYGIIRLSTVERNSNTYSVLTYLPYMPNGMQLDFNRNAFYFTDEGGGSDIGGTVNMYDINTNSLSIMQNHVDGADGCWLDRVNNRLYIGLVMKKNVLVFDTESNKLVGEYTGLSELSALHQLDDLTLFSTSSTTIDDTMILGADWLDKNIKLFNLKGTNITEINVDESLDIHKLYEVTSVRWGVGPDFDSNSIYVSEGGGLTKGTTSRRVIQIKIK